MDSTSCRACRCDTCLAGKGDAQRRRRARNGLDDSWMGPGWAREGERGVAGVTEPLGVLQWPITSLVNRRDTTEDVVPKPTWTGLLAGQCWCNRPGVLRLYGCSARDRRIAWWPGR